jgi:hypothetical protein
MQNTVEFYAPAAFVGRKHSGGVWLTVYKEKEGVFVVVFTDSDKTDLRQRRLSIYLDDYEYWRTQFYKRTLLFQNIVNIACKTLEMKLKDFENEAEL